MDYLRETSPFILCSTASSLAFVAIILCVVATAMVADA
jgi:hypothetical protein